MKQAAAAQNRLHRSLELLVNGQASTRRELVASVFSRRRACLPRARQAIMEHREFLRCRPAPSAAPETIRIPPYEGSNAGVLRMIERLEPLRDELAGAYVHGSLGSYDETGYSDFDALIVIRDDVFGSDVRLARLAARTGALQRIMIRHDPLQHHGWFVLAEADLGFYCDAYFPAELFRHAKSLFRDIGTDVCISARDSSAESREMFLALCNHIVTRLGRGIVPRTLYDLKSLLSEVMILPALYVQLRDGKAVYKKYSFDLARRDFDDATWEIMRRISAIRAGWRHDLPWHRKMWRLLLAPLPQAGARFVSSPIPRALSDQLDDEFYAAIARLVTRMRQALPVAPDAPPGRSPG